MHNKFETIVKKYGWPQTDKLQAAIGKSSRVRVLRALGAAFGAVEGMVIGQELGWDGGNIADVRPLLQEFYTWVHKELSGWK